MLKQNLNTDWTLRRADSQESFPASVPTSVYTVLAANKKIPEPYWRGNEDLVRDEIDHDFIYVKNLTRIPAFWNRTRCFSALTASIPLPTFI